MSSNQAKLVFLTCCYLLMGGIATLAHVHAQRVKVVNGKKYGAIGQVIVKKAPIRSAPKTTGRLLIVASRDTYLAIEKGKGDYLGVLMSDGSRGYILKREVKLLDYFVISSETGRSKR